MNDQFKKVIKMNWPRKKEQLAPHARVEEKQKIRAVCNSDTKN